LVPVYDDQTLATVQASGGSSFVTLNEAWAHFVRTRVAEPGYLMTVQGYDFSMLNTASTTTSDEFFAPIAVRLLVAQATREKNGKELPPSRLDTLHEWARRHSVVTPYLSMIFWSTHNNKQRLTRPKPKATALIVKPSKAQKSWKNPSIRLSLPPPNPKSGC
jgi:hypothetical protein